MKRDSNKKGFLEKSLDNFAFLFWLFEFHIK